MAFLGVLKKTNKGVSNQGELDLPPPPPLPEHGDSFPDMPPAARQASKGMQAMPPQRDFPPLGPPPGGYPDEAGAPPYAQPPRMADRDIMGKPFSPEIDLPPDNFQFDSAPGLKSREELGLEPEKDDWTSDSAQIQEPPQIKGMLPEQEMELEAPPRAASGPEKSPYVPEPIDSSDNAFFGQESQDSELEPPPRPAAPAASSADFFAAERTDMEEGRRKRQARGPLFITMTDYKDILEKNEFVKSKLKEAGDTIERVTGIEANMDREFESWRRNIADLQKRFLLVDKKIFEFNE